MSIFAYIMFALGAFISILNFHLSFVRPAIHRLRGREYRFVSGFPFVGSLLLVASYFMFPADHILRPVALVVAVCDTGGIHWFCIMMVYGLFRGRRSGGHNAA
jgi:hypothetical protein